MNAADYSVTESLRDGRQVEIRAFQPADGAGLLAAFDRTSDESRYRRFFAPKRGFSEREIAFYVNIDFVSHVALVALVEESGRPVIVGGGRYIVLEPGRAEVAFGVDDPHQGFGIGTRLMRHLAVIGREAGIREFIADVLPDNAPMLRVFERSALPMTARRRVDVVRVTLDLSQSDAGTPDIGN